MEYYCISTECGAAGGSSGVGYRFAFSSPSSITAPSSPALKSWGRAVSGIVRRIGERPFDPDSGRQAVAELVEEIKHLNSLNVFKIENIDSIPAVQVDAADGRRVEVGFDGEEWNISEDRRGVVPAEAHAVAREGTILIGPLEKGRYRFRSQAVPHGERPGGASPHPTPPDPDGGDPALDECVGWVAGDGGCIWI